MQKKRIQNNKTQMNPFLNVKTTLHIFGMYFQKMGLFLSKSTWFLRNIVNFTKTGVF